jgi:hypothetical protein
LRVGDDVGRDHRVVGDLLVALEWHFRRGGLERSVDSAAEARLRSSTVRSVAEPGVSLLAARGRRACP